MSGYGNIESFSREPRTHWSIVRQRKQRETSAWQRGYRIQLTTLMHKEAVIIPNHTFLPHSSPTPPLVGKEELHHINEFVFKSSVWTGEMALQLKIVVALVKNLGLVPSTTGQLTTVTPVPGDLPSSLRGHRTRTHTCDTHTHDTHTHVTHTSHSHTRDIHT